MEGSIPPASEAPFPGALLFRSTPVVENACILTVYLSKTVLPSSLSPWCKAHSATHVCLRAGTEQGKGGAIQGSVFAWDLLSAVPALPSDLLGASWSQRRWVLQMACI